MLVQEMLSEKVGLFSLANTTEFSYKINEDSSFMENSKKLFYFFGKVLGKALFDHIPLNICLNRSILKALLGMKDEDSYANVDEFKNIDFNVRNIYLYFCLRLNNGVYRYTIV